MWGLVLVFGVPASALAQLPSPSEGEAVKIAEAAAKKAASEEAAKAALGRAQDRVAQSYYLTHPGAPRPVFIADPSASASSAQLKYAMRCPIYARSLGVFAASLAFSAAMAGEALAPTAGTALNASVRVMFTPGDDIAGEIVQAIRNARKQVLVQAFSFTHDGIAQALVEAHKRGVEVKLIADREQTERMRRGQVAGIARAGVPVWLDGAHQGAHNKVMVIDAGRSDAQIITGSYNFTRAAQHKNAENVVFIGGNDVLVRQYAANWQRHQAHAQPLVLH